MLTKLFLLVLVAFSDGTYKTSAFPTGACPTREGMQQSIAQIMKAAEDVTDVKMACIEVPMNFSKEKPKVS